MFQRRNGVWTDLAHADSLKLVSVAPFSSAYFALTRALPELAATLSGSDPIIIARRRASVKVADGGKTSLTTAEVQEFVRLYRGV